VAGGGRGANLLREGAPRRPSFGSRPPGAVDPDEGDADALRQNELVQARVVLRLDLLPRGGRQAVEIRESVVPEAGHDEPLDLPALLRVTVVTGLAGVREQDLVADELLERGAAKVARS